MRRPAPALVGSQLAFALTGLGTALLGSTLPAILHAGRLADSRGGLLLLAAWGGSTIGAVFARGRLYLRTVLALAASGCALLGMGTGSARGLLPLYLLYGVGLGTTMTSISLLRSRGETSAAASRAMNRLNLLWALGACGAPLLAVRALQQLSASGLFRLTAMLFFGCAGLIAREGRTANSPSLRPPTSTPPRLPWAPLRFCLFAAASVGLESALGSWLTTYTARSTLAVGAAVSVNAAFWAGLLLSRGVHALPLQRWTHTPAAWASHLLLLGLGEGLLFVPRSHWLLTLAGLLCGWGLGPLYPLALSLALPHYRSTLVFVLAGVGASVVPWLTGWLSSRLGSLQLGLLAPLFCFFLLAGAASRLASRLTGLSATPEDALR